MIDKLSDTATGGAWALQGDRALGGALARFFEASAAYLGRGEFDMKLYARFGLDQFIFGADDVGACASRGRTFATVVTKLSFAVLVVAVVIAAVLTISPALDKPSTTVSADGPSASAN